MLLLLRQTFLAALLLLTCVGLALSFVDIAYSYSKDIEESTVTVPTETVQQGEARNTLEHIKHDLRLELQNEYPESAVRWLEENDLAERVLIRAHKKPELLKQVAQVREHVNLRNSEKYVNLILAVAVAQNSRQAKF